MNVTALADEIMNGRRLRRGEELGFFLLLTLMNCASEQTVSGQYFAETMLTFAA